MSADSEEPLSSEHLGSPEEQIPQELIEHAKRCWEAEVDNAERLSNKHRAMVTATAALVGLGLYKIEWGVRTDEVARVAPEAMSLVVRGLLSIGLAVLGWAFIRMRRATDFIPRVSGGIIRRGFLFLVFLLGAAFLVSHKYLSAICGLSEPTMVIAGILLVALAILGFSSLGPPELSEDDKPLENFSFSSHYLHFPEHMVKQAQQNPLVAKQMIYYSTRAASADLRDRNTQKSASLRRSQTWFVFGLALVGLAILCYIWCSEIPNRDADHGKNTVSPAPASQTQRTGNP